MTRVEASDGRAWEVRRRWLGGRSRRLVDGYHWGGRRVLGTLGGAMRASSRLTEPDRTAAPSPGTQQPNPAGIVSLALLPVYAVTGLLFVIVDGLLRVVLGGAAAVGHVALRRPWAIEATGEAIDPVVHHVVGWRASAAARHDLADALRTGRAVRSAEQ